MTDLATLYEILDGPMTDKPPPQWALDKAIAVFGEDEYEGTLYAAARLIVEERERCATICVGEGLRLGKFDTRDGISMSLCAEQMAIKIREP